MIFLDWLFIGIIGSCLLCIVCLSLPRANLVMEGLFLTLSRYGYKGWYYIERMLAKSQFSLLLLSIQVQAQKFRLIVSKPHHKAYLKNKQEFLAVFMDVLEYLVRPLAQSSQCTFIIKVEHMGVLDKVEEVLTTFRCQKWTMYPVKIQDIHVECCCKSTVIRQLMLLHYCMEIPGVKQIFKQEDQRYYCLYKDTNPLTGAIIEHQIHIGSKYPS